MKSKTLLYSCVKIWRLYVVLRQKAAISSSGNGSSGFGSCGKLNFTERLTVFMNRWLTRAEIVEVNGLTREEENQIFERLVPLDRSLGRYLEDDVDRVIGEVRRGVRPPISDQLSVRKKEAGMSMGDAWAASVSSVGDSEILDSFPPLLVSERQAARILSVSRRTVFDLEKRGILTSVRIGSLKRYALSTLKAFAEKGGV